MTLRTADGSITGCTGKKVFVRFLQAERAAKRRNRNDGGAHLEEYHCRHCNQFHVGEARAYGRRRARKEATA